MEHIILEYVKIFWGWPTATIILVLLLKKHLVLLVSTLERGIEAKLGNLYLKIPPLEIREQINEGGDKKAIVSVESGTPFELTRFQMKILKEFISRGNYDSLNVSDALIEDFRKLKMVGAFEWKSEEANERQVILSHFKVTKKGKEIGA